jgi:hypothetical protein
LFSDTFKALLKEAEFTNEMLGSGATQIRAANYASKGRYFQAFTSLSTGLERIGKLCLMLDYYIDNHREFPGSDYVKREICHNIEVIYEKSRSVISKRSIVLPHLQDLNDPIHKAILSVLSGFARGDRYSNINLLVGDRRSTDPIALWFNSVDQPLYKTRVSPRRRQSVEQNAFVVSSLLGSHVSVLHTSETGEVVANLEEASQMTGMYRAVAPYRQLYVLQIIRFWVELVWSLQDTAMQSGGQDIPFFSEIFAPFFNHDSYLRTRKTWDKFGN